MWKDISPETFPGGSYYTPDVSGSSTWTLLPMTDEEKAEAAKKEAERRRRGFGFNPIPQEDPS